MTTTPSAASSPLARRCVMLLAACTVLALSACSAYTLRGKVVPGDYSSAFIVSPDDAQLDDRGIGGATLELVMDPGTLREEVIARGVSRSDGTFELVVDEFGAGLIEIQAALIVRREGYAPARGDWDLPPTSRRILVVMTPGADLTPRDGDSMDRAIERLLGESGGTR